MIEINLLNQGHGILYKQKNIEKNLAYRRAKIFLLLILLLSSVIALYLHMVKPSEFNNPLIVGFFKNLDIIWFEENIATHSNAPQERNFLNADIGKEIQAGTKKLQNSALSREDEKLQKKAIAQEKAFYVKVASAILPESADIIQKDLLAKGFQSTRRTNEGLAKNYFVVIGPAKNQKSVESILEKIKNSDVNWEVQNIGKNGFQIVSQSFIFPKKAEQIEKQVKKKGLKGKIIQKNTPIKFHEVLIGKFNNKKEAVPVLEKIQKAGFKGIIVER